MKVVMNVSRPHHGARPRREDRRGHAAGGARSTRASSRPTSGARHERRAEPSRDRRRRNGEPVLDVEDIHTFYGAIEALKGISIEVHEGEIVTLIGSNGAGKTTTLRSISGIVPPRSGRIVFEGREIQELAGARGRADRASRTRPRGGGSSRA